MGLSLAMRWVLVRLPVICGFLYWLPVTWGILVIGTTISIIFPESRLIIFYMALLFLFSLPGIMWANFTQLKRLIRIFRLRGVTKASTGEIIYFRDYYVAQDSSIFSTPHFNGCSRDYLKSARRRTNRYRRVYRR